MHPEVGETLNVPSFTQVVNHFLFSQWRFHNDRPVLGHQFGFARLLHPVLAAESGE